MVSKNGGVSLKKLELREAIKDKLNSLTKVEKVDIEKRLTSQLIESVYWKKANVIGITISQGLEWDTKSIIEKAWKDGKSVGIPKCLPNKQMAFYQFNNFKQLEKGLYDIPEPNPEKTKKLEKDKIDLLIVPGVVYSPNGYRIGFGGGYYDRFLVDFPNRTVSIASDLQIVDRLPIDSFDIPVQQIITETKRL